MVLTVGDRIGKLKQFNRKCTTLAEKNKDRQRNKTIFIHRNMTVYVDIPKNLQKATSTNKQV